MKKTLTMLLLSATIVACLTPAVRASDDEVESLFVQGQIFASQKYYDKAEEVYLEALAKDPKHERARISLAILYGLRKEYDKGLKEIAKVQKLYPKSFLSYKVQGLLYKDAQQPQEAAKALETYLKLAPPHQIHDREDVEKLIQALQSGASAPNTP